MERIRSLLKSTLQKHGILLALVGIILFFVIATDGIILKPLNVSNVILQNSYILVLAIGMLLVIVSGNIDLSVGSIVAFIGGLMGKIAVENEFNPFITMVLVLVVGAVIGAWQGMWIAYFKLPSFIVTLGGMLIFRGLALVILGGSTIGPFPQPIRIISTGFIAEGGATPNLAALLAGCGLSLIYIVSSIRKRLNYKKNNFEVLPIGKLILRLVIVTATLNAFTILLSFYKGMPNVLILLGFLFLIYTFLTNKTTVGRRIYSLGGNVRAARLSGINTNRLTFMVFVNMGVLAALSAIVFTARLNSANSRAGSGFELDAIAACFIGGVSASGGIGTVAGVITGALIMGIMNNGMSLLGLGIDWQQTIKGLVLTLAVFFDVFIKSKNR